MEEAVKQSRDTSRPECVHCGYDLSDVLARMNMSAVLTKDIGKKEKIMRQLGRCCKDHSHMEEEVAKMIKQIRLCSLSHDLDLPVFSENMVTDASQSFFFVSKEMDEEVDSVKRKDKLRLLTRWLICLRDHQDEGKKFLDYPHRLELKYRMEQSVAEYNSDRESEGMALLEEVIVCRRDHRPRCLCRSPVDVREYQQFLFANWPTNSEEIKLKKRLFGGSQSQAEKDIEECTSQLRRVSMSTPSDESLATQALVAGSALSGTAFDFVLPRMDI